MDNDITIIHENPVSGIISFYLFFGIAGTSQLLFHVIGQRLDLTAVASAGNQKIICQNGNLTDINNTDILRFLSSRAEIASLVISLDRLSVIGFLHLSVRIGALYSNHRSVELTCLFPFSTHEDNPEYPSVYGTDNHPG